MAGGKLDVGHSQAWFRSSDHREEQLEVVLRRGLEPGLSRLQVKRFDYLSSLPALTGDLFLLPAKLIGQS